MDLKRICIIAFFSFATLVNASWVGKISHLGDEHPIFVNNDPTSTVPIGIFHQFSISATLYNVDQVVTEQNLIVELTDIGGTYVPPLGDIKFEVNMPSPSSRYKFYFHDYAVELWHDANQ